MLRDRVFRRQSGQSVVELAIFGSILMFVVSMIFRQGLNGGNYMNAQLKATRHALSKSFESSVAVNPGGNNASVMVIEDRLGGDFTNKFSSRDRVPLVSGGGGTFTNQLFYPVDKGDCGDDLWKTAGVAACDRNVLSRFEVIINGQRFSFLTANFRIIDIPVAQGGLAACGAAHPTTTQCWTNACLLVGGCLVLHRKADNYLNSEDYDAATGIFDYDFDGVDDVPAGMRGAIVAGGPQNRARWQWQQYVVDKKLPIENSYDVDGDFYEEQVLDSIQEIILVPMLDINGNPVLDAGGNPITMATEGRAKTVLVIDRQAGDIDATLDGRRLNIESGLLDESQMFSVTNNGTVYRIEEGKLFGGRDDRYIRNVNINDHVDIVQRVLQLNNNTQRFCVGGAPAGLVDGKVNPVEVCDNCFVGDNIQKTCFDQATLKLYVRSRISNVGGRSWFTKTETAP